MDTKSTPVVRLARKRLKLTQAEMANVMGVTQPSICRWEQGRGEPLYSEWKRVEEYAKTVRVSAKSLVRETA